MLIICLKNNIIFLGIGENPLSYNEIMPLVVNIKEQNT